MQRRGHRVAFVKYLMTRPRRQHMDLLRALSSFAAVWTVALSIALLSASTSSAPTLLWVALGGLDAVGLFIVCLILPDGSRLSTLRVSRWFFLTGVFGLWWFTASMAIGCALSDSPTSDNDPSVSNCEASISDLADFSYASNVFSVGLGVFWAALAVAVVLLLRLVESTTSPALRRAIGWLLVVVTVFLGGFVIVHNINQADAVHKVFAGGGFISLVLLLVALAALCRPRGASVGALLTWSTPWARFGWLTAFAIVGLIYFGVATDGFKGEWVLALNAITAVVVFGAVVAAPADDDATPAMATTTDFDFTVTAASATRRPTGAGLVF